MKLVLELSNSDIKRICHFYQDYGVQSNSEHVLFMAKTDYVTVTVYTSNKVLFQGVDATEEYKMWVQMLGLELPKIDEKAHQPTFQYDFFETSIGSDEVGTGDFFGPITVCAVYLDETAKKLVKEFGIKDSKKLTDATILAIGEQIKDQITFSLLTLHNEKFNELFEQGFNMNKMKAYLHNKAILNLLAKLNTTPKVVVDQFAEPALYFRYLKDEQDVYRTITFVTKAEDKFASVALGSIIARYAFLKHFELLIETTGYDLPKGAGNKVDLIAAQIIKEKGESFLRTIAKVNFKTVEKAKNLIK